MTKSMRINFSDHREGSIPFPLITALITDVSTFITNIFRMLDGINVTTAGGAGASIQISAKKHHMSQRLF
eukprot:11689052-Karenia_brevis.AAC.1